MLCRVDTTGSCEEHNQGARVLTMERLHGAPLTDLAAIRDVTAEDPERILINALNTWFGSVLACPSFHADVHAGARRPRVAHAAPAGGAGARSRARQRACGSQRTLALAGMHIHSCEHALCWLALRNKRRRVRHRHLHHLHQAVCCEQVRTT